MHTLGILIAFSSSFSIWILDFEKLKYPSWVKEQVSIQLLHPVQTSGFTTKRLFICYSSPIY